MLRRIKSFNLSQAPKLLWIAKFCGNLPLPCCQVLVVQLYVPKRCYLVGKNALIYFVVGKFVKSLINIFGSCAHGIQNYVSMFN